MKFAFAMLALLIGVTLPAAAAEGDRHVHLFLGQKNLSSSDWAWFDRQNEGGILTTLAETTWPVGIAADVLYSTKTAFRQCVSEFGCSDDTVETFEVALGVRRHWRTGIVHLGLGGGITQIRVSINDDSDRDVGPWAGGSCFFHVGRRFDIGAHVRWAQAEVSIPTTSPWAPDDKFDAGGWHAGLILGVAW